jgi:hypothetical protein
MVECGVLKWGHYTVGIWSQGHKKILTWHTSLDRAFEVNVASILNKNIILMLKIDIC